MNKERRFRFILVSNHRVVTMNVSEKFCLKWNDFQSSVCQTFQDLRNNKDFCDVTIACEDDQQIEAHKVVLSACSPFFRNVLKKNNHPHPLLYLKGIEYSDLLPVLDFIYQGETSVAQEDLTRFMALAEELKLKGLTNDSQSDQNLELPRTDFQCHESSSMLKEEPNIKSGFELHSEIDTLANNESESHDTLVEMYYDDAEESKVLEVRIGELMERGDDGWSCKACGKTNKDKSKIKYHVETHLHGVSHTCPICGKSCSSKNTLNNHISLKHRQ